MSNFNREDWESRGEIPYQVDSTELELSIRRVNQGLAFISQQWGWAGPYYESVGSTLKNKRDLMAATFGETSHFLRKDNPQIADIKIVFGQDGFTNWVDYQSNEVLDYQGLEFQFPGAPSCLAPTGLPWKFSPYIAQGSYVYFEETPLIEADFDPELEYIDSLGLWRAKANQLGLVRFGKLEGASELLEFEIIPWEPSERELGVWLGTWGSKGTMDTVRVVSDLSCLHGVDPLNSIKLLGRVIRVPIPEEYDFSDIFVDDVRLGSRRFRGIENRTRGTSRATISLEPGNNLTVAFTKVEVEIVGPDTQRIDVTQQLLDNPQYSVHPSVKNASVLLEPWFTPALRADISVCDINEGTESPRAFLRLPFSYSRDSSQWVTAEAICELFVHYGKSQDEFKFTQRVGERTVHYDSEYRDFRPKKFYQEDYLVSNFKDIDSPEEEGYSSALRIGLNTFEEPGWVSGGVYSYKENDARETNGNFWAGDWYTKVGERRLNGFLSEDIRSGKLLSLPYTPQDFHPYRLPRLEEDWEEKTNFMMPCYAFAAADLCAADEPVFEI